MASGQMQLGLTLRDRLPKVAALFMAGTISSRLVAVIAWRTYLVRDEKALHLIDTALAERVIVWGPLPSQKLESAIDLWIDRYDPGALRRNRTVARNRGVSFGAVDDQAGTAAMWGRLYATDAAVLDRRLMEIAHSVCDDDPRTIAQHRADALGALAAGGERLVCGCGSPDCLASLADYARSSSVVIHVVAEAPALDAHPDPHMSGEHPPGRPITCDMTLVAALTPDPEPDVPAASTAKPPAALIVGGGVVPTPLLAELVCGGAKVRHIGLPGDAPPERRYRPSAKLEEFIRRAKAA